MTENDLIKKAQDGDEDALNSLITNYYQAVFAYFYKNTSQYHQSKDLTQEVFIKIAAVSISTMFLLLEFLFNKFTFPTIIQEYNVWVFFEPYYLFILEIFNISPYTNLLLLSVAFLPLCIFAVWQIVKNGA